MTCRYTAAAVNRKIEDYCKTFAQAYQSSPLATHPSFFELSAFLFEHEIKKNVWFAKTTTNNFKPFRQTKTNNEFLNEKYCTLSKNSSFFLALF